MRHPEAEPPAREKGTKEMEDEAMGEVEDNTENCKWQTVRHGKKRASPHTVNMEQDEDEDRIEEKTTQETDLTMEETSES